MIETIADFRAVRPRMTAAFADACQAALREQELTEPSYALCLSWTTGGDSILESIMMVCAPDSTRRTGDGGYDDEPYLVWNPMEWPSEMVTGDELIELLDPEIRDLCHSVANATRVQIDALIASQDAGTKMGLTTDESFGYETMLLLRDIASDLASRDLGFERTDDFVAYELHLDAMDFDTVREQASPAALALLQERGLL